MAYLVTGGTGFIGRHLLKHLVKRRGTVYVLVREQSVGRFERVLESLNAPPGRIVPVIGDLTASSLGLSRPDRVALEGVAHFYHLAAVYDMQATAEANRRTNIEGTLNAVDLANELGAKRFHHVSSIAVAGNFDGIFTEQMFDQGQRLDHPYFATKFESERIVRTALDGPWRVYRPGIVVGGSATGEMDKIDGPYYFFPLIKRLGEMLPRWTPLVGIEGGRPNIVPVDYVAAALDHIGHKPRLDKKVFHLTDPDPPTAGELINIFAKAANAPGFSVRLSHGAVTELPLQILKAAELLPPARMAIKELMNEIGVPRQALEYATQRTLFDSANTEAALADSKIELPPLKDYADKLWQYWERDLNPDLFENRPLQQSISGKVIVITGASSGIGNSLALRAGRAGAVVCLVARSKGPLDETVEEIKRTGGVAYAHPADLTNYEDIDRVVNEIMDEHGRVDILVNNAGRSIRRSVENSYDRFHDFERTMQLNYFGSLRLILGVLPGMRERGFGQIINVSSIGAQTNMPRFSAYVASKSALDAFSRCVAAEVKGDNVHFTTIYMPLVRTAMIAPTKIYSAFPTISPDQASRMIAGSMIDRPKKVASRLGNFGELLYSFSPKTADTILNTGYKLFPESAAASRKGREEADHISAEAVAFAHVLRGLHW